MEIEIDTPKGPGRADLEWPKGTPRYLLAVTHGAGGGVDAPDITAVRDAALASGGAVARVTQPYRAAGRRMPGAHTGPQDLAWSAMIEKLRAEPDAAGVPLVLGGRSNGARVVCRTASALGAEAVVALAFPLHPPGRPEKSRAGELRGAGVPVLVVNGDRDPFGVPDAADAAALEVRPGERHELSKAPEGIGRLVAEWLGERFPRR